MSFPYPELWKMSAYASTYASYQASDPLIETGTLIRTDAITKLTRADNYLTWERQVVYLPISIEAEAIVYLLHSIEAEEIVLENL
jgi:hypothetical protein